MESQKIVNLLNNNGIESQTFTTKKWYIINDQSYTITILRMMEIILLLNLKLK